MAVDLILAENMAPNLSLACKQMTQYVNKFDGLPNYGTLYGAGNEL